MSLNDSLGSVMSQSPYCCGTNALVVSLEAFFLARAAAEFE